MYTNTIYPTYSSFNNIISEHSVYVHFYMDDTQLYLSLSLKPDETSGIKQLQICHEDRNLNVPKLSADKIKFLCWALNNSEILTIQASEHFESHVF